MDDILSVRHLLTHRSIRLPPQLPPYLRFPQNPHHRPLRPSNSLQHHNLHARLSPHGSRRLPHLRLANSRQRPQQLLLNQHARQHRSSLLRPQHAHHPPTRMFRLPRSNDELLVQRRAFQHEPPSHLHHIPGRQLHDAQSRNLRLGCGV